MNRTVKFVVVERHPTYNRGLESFDTLAEATDRATQLTRSARTGVTYTVEEVEEFTNPPIPTPTTPPGNLDLPDQDTT